QAMANILHQPAIHLSLVDKQHKLPDGYEPADLVHLDQYGLSVSRNSLELRKAIMPEIMSMVDAARADHVVLLFSSTYRSFATQTAVYDREVQLYGKKVADSESAVPGHSQHQMGTTIDFGCICNDFAKTAAYKWLNEYAWKYGFSMTYPDGYENLTGYRYEPWHWHYITTAGTLAQRDFFDNIQQYLLLFLNENRSQLVSTYRGSDLGPGWAPAE
ncbi:MAG TPA: M15 family metallopeptidase, partial [Spirochaetia bacterium]|nr:M15 family metallopeptidase [Spirochaetia bacterium]